MPFPSGSSDDVPLRDIPRSSGPSASGSDPLRSHAPDIRIDVPDDPAEDSRMDEEEMRIANRDVMQMQRRAMDGASLHASVGQRHGTECAPCFRTRRPRRPARCALAGHLAPARSLAHHLLGARGARGSLGRNRRSAKPVRAPPTLPSLATAVADTWRTVPQHRFALATGVPESRQRAARDAQPQQPDGDRHHHRPARHSHPSHQVLARPLTLYHAVLLAPVCWRGPTALCSVTFLHVQTACLPRGLKSTCPLRGARAVNSACPLITQERLFPCRADSYCA